MNAARILHEARLAHREIPRLTEQLPELTLPQAYAIQAEGIALRQAAGERFRAYKMGLTSEAKRVQMGLHAPIYGVLTDRMELPGPSARLERAGLIHPRAEPELALRVDRELRFPCDERGAWDAVGAMAAAVEILDSRFVGFKYFSLPDVVADNASSSHYVLGPPAPKTAPEAMASLRITLRKNGEPAGSAPATDVSGHPLLSLVALARLLHEGAGLAIPAGTWVLTGAAVAALPGERGDVFEARLEGDEPGNENLPAPALVEFF